MLFGANKPKPTYSEQELNDLNQLMDRLNPVYQKLNQNVILFWLGKSWSYLTEILLYVTGIACIGFNFIMQNVFPFHVLDEILHRPTFKQIVSNPGDFKSFGLAVHGLVILIGILFLVMGFRQRGMRTQRNLLRETSTSFKAAYDFLAAKQKALLEVMPETNATSDHLTRVEPKPFPKSDSSSGTSTASS